MVYAPNSAGDAAMDEQGGGGRNRRSVKRGPVDWDRIRSDRAGTGTQRSRVFKFVRGLWLGHARTESGGSQAGMLAGAEHQNEDERWRGGRVLDIRSDGDEYDYKNGHDHDHHVAGRDEHEWRAEELYGYGWTRDLEGGSVDAASGVMLGPQMGEEHEVYEMRRM